MWNLLSKNPEIIIFLLVGAAGLLGRLKKAIQAGEGPGGIRIPQPTEIKTHAPLPPRTAPGQAAPARVQPVRRPGRPRPGRPQGLRKPPQAQKRPPAPVRAQAKRPESEGPGHATDHPVESHFEASKAPVAPIPIAVPPLQMLMSGPNDLRRAILMAEVLGRPLALR